MSENFDIGLFEDAVVVLKHPLRRRILEYLWEKEYSFNELSKLCEEDHGKIGYHLRKMKRLVRHHPDRKVYQLTREGRLAHDLLLQGLSNFQNTVNETKRAENEVERHRSQFKTLFNSIPDPIIIIGQRGKILSLNDRVEAVTGLKREELVGKSLPRTKILTPRSRTILRRNLTKRRKGIPVPPFEVEVVMEEDGRSSFEVSLERIEYSGKPSELAIFRDIAERKKAKEEILRLNGELEQRVVERTRQLRASEEKYRTLVETSHEGIMIVTEGLQIAFANKRMYEMLGYKEGELIGRDYLSLIPSSEIEDFRERRKRSIELREGAIFERKMTRKDRIEMSTLVASSPHFDVKDEYLGATIFYTDITEHEKARKALQESEERYKTLFELSPSGIVTLDMKGNVTSVNETAVRFTGFTKEELIGRHFSKLGTTRMEDVHRYMQIFGSIMRGKIPEPFEFQYQRKDGIFGWAQAHFGPLESKGRRMGFQVVMLDITFRKQVEDALRTSEEKMRTMLESVPEGITVTDLEANILQLNEAVLRLHEYKHKNELIGQNALKLISPEDHTRAMENMKRTLEEGSSGVIEYTFLTKDGEPFPAELSAAIMKNESGNPIGFIAVTKKITEHQKAQD